jgi:hypothetical protein
MDTLGKGVVTKTRLSLVAAAVGAAVLSGAGGGCDRSAPPQQPPVPTPVAPATSPVAVAPAPAAGPATTPTSRPTSSLINVNGHMTVFPAARLRLESDGQRLVALLFSDDPKDALRDNYTGNSFYLRFDLDVDDPGKLLDATWHYTAPSSGDQEDSPYGIYLGGRKLQLQPYDFSGRFKATEEGTEVLFTGQFKVLDDTAARGGPAQLVTAAAALPVRIESDVKAASE